MVGDGVVAVGCARADGVPVFLGVPVLVGAGGLTDVLRATGSTEQALSTSTSTDASVTNQQGDGPIRTERG